MIKNIAKTTIALVALSGVVGCNSNSDDDESVVYVPYSAEVTAFSLSTRASAVANMDSVYFSIDQLNLRIYNADSLPVGSDVTRMVPKITVNSAQTVELKVKRAGLPDTTYNYLTNNTDSIDFSNPVTLHVVSYDGLSTADYTISVNVHKTAPDTLVWTRTESGSIPSAFTVVSRAGTAHTADAFHCLTYYDGAYCMASAADPAAVWQFKTPAFDFTPQVETLTATDNVLFILADDNRLMTSTDGGVTWTASGQTWTAIYGAHVNTLLGGAYTNGRHQLVTWPATPAVDAPADFPVTATSQTVTYTVEMSDTPQTLITGGRKADGTLSADTWGFDGTTWAKLSVRPLPEGLEGLTVVPYFTVSLSANSWRTSTKSMLVAMFGRKADGELNDKVYMSPDMGMNWRVADSLLQSVTEIPARVGARGFVYKQTMHARGLRTAIKPVTEWDCPYIYLFGGQNKEGVTYNTLYRGVINRFTFKPLQ